MNLLRLVLRNLSRQPRRAILTMLTFAVATFIFNVLVSIPASIDMILKHTSETLRLYSYNADGRYLGLPARDCAQVEKLPGVVACMPMTNLRATYQNQHEIIQTFAVDADRALAIYPDYGFQPAVIDRFIHERTGAMVGKLLMRNHRWKVGDTITLRGDSNRLDIRFKIVSQIPSDNYPSFFMFHRDYLVEAEKAIGIPEEKHPAAILVTRVTDERNVSSVTREIDSAFHNSDFETATMTESEAVSGLLSSVGDIRSIVYGLFAVILLTVFLIAANSMSMTVRDRVHDVAVLRSLGFGPMYVAAMLLGECAVVAAVGGIVGSAIAIWQFGSGTTLGAVLSYAGFLAMTPGAALTAFFIAVTVGIASASAPVIGALRAPPAEALRKII
ncbi:MAG TPA: ABC transporter permease [Candidatus Binataceae bacterium]|nr:ABC transporter permease [Candidatus Binataceae bacterium]